MRRVAITGLGVVCACGNAVEEFWQSISNGRSAIGPIQTPACTSLKFTNGAEANSFDPLQYLDPKSAAQLDRSVQFAAAASKQALTDSGATIVPHRTAVITGCAIGGKPSEDESYRQLYAESRTRFNPLTIPKIMANASASWISMQFGITGPCYNISTACASAGHAIGQAFWMIRCGMADLAVTGGTEAPFALGLLHAWEAMRVVSPNTCRPFSKDRRGLILGEGAAMLVLEPYDHAIARGAKIYATIDGFGMSSDASHLTAPSAEGAAHAMLAALADAKIAPADVGYINAHGTGTAANDATESRAIRTVFADPPPVSSTKSMHGHALGASPALEAVATVLALHHGILPPTANFTEADPECLDDVIPNVPRIAQVELALSNSFAFGGLNAALLFRR